MVNIGWVVFHHQPIWNIYANVKMDENPSPGVKPPIFSIGDFHPFFHWTMELWEEGGNGQWVGGLGHRWFWDSMGTTKNPNPFSF